MRMFLKATWQVEAGNAAIKDGTMGAKVGSILADLKPEAAYFVADGGKRTSLIFLDVSDPSQLPAIAEPFFLAFNADVEVTPAMTVEDLEKAGPSIGEAVAKYC